MGGYYGHKECHIVLSAWWLLAGLPQHHCHGLAVGCFFNISDVFFYVIIGWVKGEGSPSFMQMFDITALGREVPAKVFCKLFPIAMESISIQTMVPFLCQMVQSVFKLCQYTDLL